MEMDMWEIKEKLAERIRGVKNGFKRLKRIRGVKNGFKRLKRIRGMKNGKDYAKIIKNQSKPGNIKHKIGSLHQKPDQRAFFYNNQANEAKCQKIERSRSILAIYPKSKSMEKGKSKFKG
nr:hypothetical protein [Tanacetum cinerariifolium]